jgi:hypothetical protein
MSDSIKDQPPRQSICNDCTFHALIAERIECIHPDELEVSCSTVIFCDSFQSTVFVDSPCVSFGDNQD